MTIRKFNELEENEYVHINSNKERYLGFIKSINEHMATIIPVYWYTEKSTNKEVQIQRVDIDMKIRNMIKIRKINNDKFIEFFL